MASEARYWIGYEISCFVHGFRATRTFAGEPIKARILMILLPVALWVITLVSPWADTQVGETGVTDEWIVAVAGLAVVIAVTLVALLVSLVLAPWRLARDHRRNHDSRLQQVTSALEASETNNLALKAKLTKISDSKPNIVFDRSSVKLVHRTIQLDRREATAIIESYYAGQICFKNVPSIRTQETVAKEIAATVEFWETDRSSVRHKFPGVWAISDHTGWTGWKQEAPAVEMQPHGLPAKLLVAIKYDDDAVCFGYNGEGLSETEMTRTMADKAKELPRGQFPIRITLAGVGVDDTFWFDFDNEGPNSSMKISRSTP